MTSTNHKLMLVDCDGVLVSWVDSFRSWMAARGFSEKDQSAYSISQKYGIPKDLSDSLSREFCDSDEILDLRPFPGTVDVMRKLHFVHGYRFTVITSLSDNPRTLTKRRSNLYKVFGPELFEDIICLPHDAKKDSVLSKWKNSGLWWVEDVPQNAEAGIDQGLRSLLINRPYNLDFCTRALRVNNWDEILAIITHDPRRS